jgi:hypothetical protein
MSLLINSRIKRYDLLTIQKSWRNVCVSTFYNSFNIDFHLLLLLLIILDLTSTLVDLCESIYVRYVWEKIF